MNPASDKPGRDRLHRRRQIVLGIAIVAILASVGGLLLSATIKSPAQLAAETRSPGLTRLTAPVQRRVISVSVMAQAVISKPEEVSMPASGAGRVGAQGSTEPIVTRVFRHPGSILHPGEAILEVNGDPVFVFQGTVPSYRDMTSGEQGLDIAQLQAGLATAGYPAGSDARGVFGAGTASAVAAFYRAMGYQAPTTSAGRKARHVVMVPATEVMFVPRFPARLLSLGARVGHVAKGSLVTVSVGRPSIRGQLNPGDAGLVRPGMSVAITDPVTHRAIGGTVTSVSHLTKTKGSIIGGIYLSLGIRPDRPLPRSLVGQNVGVIINAAGSAGPVLAVPEAAVFAHADGRTYVAKVTGATTEVDIPVRIGVTGDGYVQVTPIGGGTLAPGDQVVTGENYAVTGPGARLGGAGPRPLDG